MFRPPPTSSAVRSAGRPALAFDDRAVEFRRRRTTGPAGTPRSTKLGACAAAARAAGAGRETSLTLVRHRSRSRRVPTRIRPLPTGPAATDHSSPRFATRTPDRATPRHDTASVGQGRRSARTTSMPRRITMREPKNPRTWRRGSLEPTTRSRRSRVHSWSPGLATTGEDHRPYEPALTPLTGDASMPIGIPFDLLGAVVRDLPPGTCVVRRSRALQVAR
jgi:hypothetical protein